ncbi:hypothetical protein AGIG_G7523 [Arapaima gigas]
MLNKLKDSTARHLVQETRVVLIVCLDVPLALLVLDLLEFQEFQVFLYLVHQELRVLRLLLWDLLVRDCQAYQEHRSDLACLGILHLGFRQVLLVLAFLFALDSHLFLEYLTSQAPREFQLDQVFQPQEYQADLQDPSDPLVLSDLEPQECHVPPRL